MTTPDVSTHLVIYPNDQNGGVVFLAPSPFCGLAIHQIALKDVPPGKPFRYLNRDDAPDDFRFFDAFEADFSLPDGYGADYGFGSTTEVIGWSYDGQPILKGQP